MDYEHDDGRAAGGVMSPPSRRGERWSPPPAPPNPPSEQRGRGSRLGIAIALAGALLVGAAVGVPIGLLTRGSAPAAPASRSGGGAAAAQALYKRALSAMRASAGCHYVATSSGGSVTQTIVGDAGQDGGRQVITVQAPSLSEQFTLLLIAGTVYFEGNLGALEDQLGVPAARAGTLLNQWVSVSSQDGPYGVVAPGITTADQAGETLLVPTASAPVRASIGPATRIVGRVPQQGGPDGTGHLDIVRATGLPFTYATSASANGVTGLDSVTFSAWGTAPAVSTPPSAVAWATLGASPPPGGYGSGAAGAAPSPSSGA